MKKRILTLTLAVMMIAATLIGCGNSTNENVTPETNTEVTTETPTPDTTTPEVDVPETEVGDNDVDVETFFSTSYALDFPDGMTGFTDKYVFSSDETWSLNNTHYVDNSGNTMNFEWEGPTELGELATSVSTNLFLFSPNKDHMLIAYTTGALSPETYDETITYGKDVITSFANNELKYVPEGYYNANVGDTYTTYTFAVKGDVNSDTYVGYAHYILDRNSGICYQFVYSEKEAIYDDARTLKLVNSIKIWEYTPNN